MATPKAPDGGGEDSGLPKDLSAELKKQNISAEAQLKIQRALLATGKQILDVHREVSDVTTDYTNAYKNYANLLKQAVDHSKKYLGSSKELDEMMKGKVKLEKEFVQLLQNGNDYARNVAETTKEIYENQATLMGYTGEAAKYYADQLEKGEKINKNELDVLQAKQDQIDFVKKEQELQLKIKERGEEILKSHNKLKDTIKQELMFMKEMANNPKLLGAVLAKEMGDRIGKVVHSFHELENSGLAVGQRIDYMSKGFSIMSTLGLSDTKGVLDGMLETYGTLNGMTDDQVDSVGHLAKEMGIGGKEAFAMVDAFSKMPGQTMETATHSAEYVKNLAKANNVAPGKLSKDIAKNTELMALGGYKTGKAFADAAMKAQKMGVELSTTKNVMNGLLNFEDSINKQMEASVLLGKEINLDKARELALQGKSVEATEEVLKNVGGSAEFDKMNVIQKQALAAAAGMTVEELQKTIDAQEEYNKYHGKDVDAWKKGLGYTMEWGSAGVKFMKENATAMLSSIALLQQMGNLKLGQRIADAAHWVKEKAHLAFLRTASALGSKGAAAKLAEKTGGGTDKLLDAAGGAGDKSKKLSDAAKNEPKKGAGGGIKGFLKNLRDGLAEFGKKFGPVLQGALLMVLVGAMIGIGLAAIGKAVKAMGGSAAEMVQIG